MDVHGNDENIISNENFAFQKALLKTFIMNPMRVSLTDFTTKFCLINVFRRWNA